MLVPFVPLISYWHHAYGLYWAALNCLISIEAAPRPPLSPPHTSVRTQAIFIEILLLSCVTIRRFLFYSSFSSYFRGFTIDSWITIWTNIVKSLYTYHQHLWARIGSRQSKMYFNLLLQNLISWCTLEIILELWGLWMELLCNSSKICSNSFPIVFNWMCVSTWCVLKHGTY